MFFFLRSGQPLVRDTKCQYHDILSRTAHYPLCFLLCLKNIILHVHLFPDICYLILQKVSLIKDCLQKGHL